MSEDPQSACCAANALVCLRRVEGPVAQAAATEPPPFGPGWDPVTAAALTRFEEWGTSFAAPEDYCEFRGYAGDRLVRSTRLPGY